jgi:hypothetical protein
VDNKTTLGGEGMKKTLLFFMCLAGIFLLSSCKVDLIVDLYVKDIVEIANGDEKIKPIETPAILKIQVQSCEEGLDKIIDILKDSFPDPKIKECENEGPNSIAKVGTTIYLYNSDHFKKHKANANCFFSFCYSEELPGVFGLVAGVTGFQDTITGEKISLYVNKRNFKILSDRVKNKFSTGLKIGGLVLDLNNDERKNIYVDVVPSFLDGGPVLGFDERFAKVKRRGRTTIQVSNVHEASLRKKGILRGIVKIVHAGQKACENYGGVWVGSCVRRPGVGD